MHSMQSLNVWHCCKRKYILTRKILGSNKFCGLGTIWKSNIDFIDIIMKCALDMKQNNSFSKEKYIYLALKHVYVFDNNSQNNKAFLYSPLCKYVKMATDEKA